MHSQSAQLTSVPRPFEGSRRDVREFLGHLAQTDPQKAWELSLQYETKDRLADVVLLLGFIGALVGIVFVVLLLMLARL